MIGRQRILILAMLVCGAATPAVPEDPLIECLKAAERAPKATLTDSKKWIERGGGDKAKLCHAFALFHGKQNLFAAEEFRDLAKKSDLSKDKTHASDLHAQAARSYARAGDLLHAEEEYNAALYYNRKNAAIWFERAQLSLAVQRYWDALSHAGEALKHDPKNKDILKFRADLWKKLGLKTKAQEDLKKIETP